MHPAVRLQHCAVVRHSSLLQLKVRDGLMCGRGVGVQPETESFSADARRMQEFISAFAETSRRDTHSERRHNAETLVFVPMVKIQPKSAVYYFNDGCR